MSAYDKYTKEDWSKLLTGVLPLAQMSGVLNKYKTGIEVNVRLIASVTKESYENAEKKYFKDIESHPERYSKEYLIDNKSNFIVTSAPFEVGESLAFVLNLPFEDLPLYVNTHVEYIRKLVQSRLELRK